MILASALLLLTQNPAAPREHFDHVDVIVNDDVIRWREIIRTMQREAQRQPLTTEHERNVLLGQVTSQFVEDLLRRQAGQDLGLDPALVRQQVNDNSDRFIENIGSVLGASEVLKEASLDSAQARDIWEGNLYNSVWQDSVTGLGPDHSGRVVNDRYVRPGEVYARYREYREPPPWAPRLNPEEIGGVDEQAVLREINIDGRNIGPEEALATCQDAREEAESGADLDEVHAWAGGPPPTPKPFGMFELERVFPDVGSWLRNAKPGDLSPVLPHSSQGRITGYHFIQLVERTEAVIPPFENAKTQRLIYDQLLRDRDSLKIQAALQDLFERAYIWPPELANPPKRSAGPPR